MTTHGSGRATCGGHDKRGRSQYTHIVIRGRDDQRKDLVLARGVVGPPNDSWRTYHQQTQFTRSPHDAGLPSIHAGPDPEFDGISAYTLEDLARICAERFGKPLHRASMSRVLLESVPCSSLLRASSANGAILSKGVRWGVMSTLRP